MPDETNSPGDAQEPELLPSLNEGPGQTSDVRLMARAIRQRWPMSDAVRKEVIRRLFMVVESPNTSDRERVSACRALIAADAINLKDQAAQSAAEARERAIEAIGDALNGIGERAAQRKLQMESQGGGEQVD